MPDSRKRDFFEVGSPETTAFWRSRWTPTRRCDGGTSFAEGASVNLGAGRNVPEDPGRGTET
ncbi:MAG: hypothetical protein M3283_10760, partial [Actinomycetota bacterium]|nr:hypothetical protein [Actinomycetota bacterium]